MNRKQMLDTLSNEIAAAKNDMFRHWEDPSISSHQEQCEAFHYAERRKKGLEKVRDFIKGCRQIYISDYHENGIEAAIGHPCTTEQAEAWEDE